jgi:hypothetical protein
MSSKKLDLIKSNMKHLSANELRQIAYNCRKATFLIEKQLIGTITSAEKMERRIHLKGCSVCVTFMRQSLLINQIARKLMNTDSVVLKLEDGFKEQLQERVNDRLNGNKN